MEAQPGAQSTCTYTWLGAKEISFVRSGEQTTETNMQRREGILSMARDWELRDDIEKKLIFLPMVETTQRPDILLISKARRKWWWLNWQFRGRPDVRRPMKERLLSIKTYWRSAGKQDDKRGAFRSKWGQSGFPAVSCWKMMASLGMSGQTRKRAVSANYVAAERAVKLVVATKRRWLLESWPSGVEDWSRSVVQSSRVCYVYGS